MATPTYTALGTITLSSAAASITFSNIDQSYGHLIITIDGAVSTGEDLNMYINTDTTAANYSNVRMGGTGSVAFSNATTNARITSLDVNPGVTIIQVMDYSATDKHTTSLSRTSTAQNRVVAYAHRWANTAAVNSIELEMNGGYNFNSGTTLSLYGVAK